MPRLHSIGRDAFQASVTLSEVEMASGLKSWVTLKEKLRMTWKSSLPFGCVVVYNGCAALDWGLSIKDQKNRVIGADSAFSVALTMTDARQTIPVIYNPASRGGNSANKGAMLQALSPLIDLVPTGGPGDATNIAERLVRSGVRQIVAAGGDGTINEVIKGVLNADSKREVAFGVLPMGTANVFALELGLPMNNLERCWQIIEQGESRLVDVWTGNGKPFIQLAGIGFDAAVIDETSYEFKQLVGPMSYVLNAMRIFGESHETITVDADTVAAPFDAAFVLVGNGKRYGGPLKFFPDAVNDDGLLDVVVFCKQELAVLLKFFHAITLGHMPKSGGDFFGFQCKNLKITSAHSVPYELDGELGGSTPLEIVHAGKLQVSVPVVS